ncbi:recombinase family protein [Streptomyces niphimycinicus]|uniref:recombinase family protein n=1 Tax=Streptomyces niphimycinicus TaxID=2842201 RepID=UPI00263B3791|nr:recombinase family protein [Streptomyces niphimycinicus]
MAAEPGPGTDRTRGWGDRCRVLRCRPDPCSALETPPPGGSADTAPVVARIFTEFLSGHGIFAIAEDLTRDGIPSPSAHDRARNPHRDTRAWAKSAVRAILGNPRYTGRQVWNRQHKHEALLDIHDVTLGHTTAMRWNSQDKWIVSKKIVHTPLVDDDVFARVQDLFAVRSRPGTTHQKHRTRNPYLYRGRITCGICTRRMQGQWSHGDAYYRCRFPEEYALANRVHHPRNIYLRESWITVPLDNWLATVFLPHRLDDTIDLMATAAAPDQEPAAAAVARAVIADCDAKLATHRTVLEAGADPTLVTQWIAETQARRVRAEAELRSSSKGAGARMSRDEIARLVRSISDLAAVIQQAEAEDKAEIYRLLGLRLTYAPAQATVRAEISLGSKNDKSPRPTNNRGELVRVRGPTRTIRTRRSCGESCFCRSPRGRAGGGAP